jgi:membrane-associated phospholipid phosphatase
VPTREEVETHTKAKGNPRLYLSPDLCPDNDALRREFAFIKILEQQRTTAPYPIIRFQPGMPPGDFRQLTDLSRFIHLKPPPFGAIFDTVERPQFILDRVSDQHLNILIDTLIVNGARRPARIVNEGRELARMFEDETPGLYHRHALNWLLFLRRDISPPRHARIWMGLDIAIYTALAAAWYYKWRGPTCGRLLRPSEYAVRTGQNFTVLYDEAVNVQGHDERQNERRDCPGRPPGTDAFHPDSPGTPRHPAWPSGHSTYSAAATYMLEYFFSPETINRGVEDEELFQEFPADRQITRETLRNPRWIAAELRRLANNIGEARLWGGVHWVSDHVAGQRIGRSAAQAVIDTFRKDEICRFESMPCDNANLRPPPTPAQLDAKWEGCIRRPDPAQDAVPQPRDPGREALLRESGGF